MFLRSLTLLTIVVTIGCTEPCYETGDRPEAQGTLRNAVSDIDYANGYAFVTFDHKRDVDPIEDGCIGEARLRVMNASLECLLELEFSAREGETALKLDSAVFTANSDCPGWLDDVEAAYEWDGQGEGASLSIPIQAPDNKEEACVEAPALQPTGRITLQAPGEEDVEIDLSDVAVTGGWVSSHGQEELGCPALSDDDE